MSETTEEKTAAAAQEKNLEPGYPYIVAVKFRSGSRPYTFGTGLADLKAGDYVVVETAQGVELGTVQAAPLSTEKYPGRQTLKPVLRRAEEKDIHAWQGNQEMAREAFRICQEEIESLGLNMNLQSADYMLDRSKILFIYVADQRVDFRELLRRLNARLHCKIELRQIGERDKARMTGGIGMCGMECCCSRFKRRFDVISINMAKTQLMALNIEKLSGMCGKLMCCLKYENDAYKELTDGLPKMGAHVEYEGEMYRVTSMNVMTNEARIENAETFQILTLDQLREKAVVRKGVALARRGARRPRQVGTTPERPQRDKILLHQHTEDLVQAQPEELAPVHVTLDEKPQPARTKNSGGRNRNGRKNTASAAGRPQKKNDNNTAGRSKSSRSRNRRPDAHRGLKPQNDHAVSLQEAAKNQPNITVRSFKSSRTRAAEAGSEKK